MSKVNLYDATGAVIAAYDAVISFGADFVEYLQGDFRTKIYCNVGEGEYFAEASTDDEATEADYQTALSELGVTFDEES